jgi:mxaA protein
MWRGLVSICGWVEVGKEGSSSILKKGTKKLLLLGCGAFFVPAHAQTVVLHGPERDFGYFVGDVIVTEAVVTSLPGARIDRLSLPVPGLLSASIELRHVDLQEVVTKNQRKTVLRLEYQSFFAPDHVMLAELPGFDLRFASKMVHVPAWAFHVSPLRVAQRSIDALADLHGNLPVAPLSGRPAGIGLLVSSGIALVAGTACAGLQGWLPGFSRSRRPFADAARHIARLAPAQMEIALRSLLQAFDATDGRHVFAEDIDAFLSRHAPFVGLREDIVRIYALARDYLFAPTSAATEADRDFAAIVVLARTLRRAERRW